MPTIHAGKKPNGDYRIISLSDSQMAKLGFIKGVKPIKLGSGASASAYLPIGKAPIAMDEKVKSDPSSPSKVVDAVIKISTDPRDAITSFMIMNLPQIPSWSIPIYAVWRLWGASKANVYAICSAKGEPLPKWWATPIDEIYKYTDRIDLQADEWNEFHKGLIENIEDIELEEGKSEDSKRMRHAIALIDEVVKACKGYGLDFSDCHAANFSMFSGRPVIVDMGIGELVKSPPKKLMERLEEIPKLPAF